MSVMNDPILAAGEAWKAQIAQSTQAVAVAATAPSADPLTENEAIGLVKQWAEDDDDIEISERRTFEEMVEDLEIAAENRTSDVKDFESIVRKYAPNAPHAISMPVKQKPESKPEYISETMSLIEPLVKSGVAFRQTDHWFVKRCTKCGQFKNECCGRIDEYVSLVRDDERTLTGLGRQAVGLDPVKPPKPPKTVEEVQQQWTKSSWWNDFRGVGELAGNGTVKMYIENVLPEGVTIISGLPKEGKSFLALSIAKALTTGKPLFGRPGFDVPEITPVLYLAAESGDGALRLRCEKMGITKDKTRFIARTLSQGPMFGLNDDAIRDVIRTMRPVVVLETLIRFNDGGDEDSSTENRKLAEAIFGLIAWGAKAVVGIHHSRKDLNKANPTKEAAVRGSGDGLAMVDCVWLVMQDERAYQRGKGSIELDVMGWGRDFNPRPMRLALTKVAPEDTPAAKMFSPGHVSLIDTTSDLGWVDRGIVFDKVAADGGRIEELIVKDPSISRKALADETGLPEWDVRKALKSLGYHRPKGDKNTTRWVKQPNKEDPK